MPRDAAQSSVMPHCRYCTHPCIHQPWKMTLYFVMKSLPYKPLVLILRWLSMTSSGTAVMNQWLSGLLLRSFHKNFRMLRFYTFLCCFCFFLFFAFAQISSLTGAKGLSKVCIDISDFTLIHWHHQQHQRHLFYTSFIMVLFNTAAVKMAFFNFCDRFYFGSNLICAVFEGHEALNNSVHLE